MESTHKPFLWNYLDRLTVLILSIKRKMLTHKSMNYEIIVPIIVSIALNFDLVQLSLGVRL